MKTLTFISLVSVLVTEADNFPCDEYCPVKGLGMGSCSPTPVLPTLDQKVVFHLLVKNIWHQSNILKLVCSYHDWLCLYQELEFIVQVNAVLVQSKNVKS